MTVPKKNDSPAEATAPAAAMARPRSLSQDAAGVVSRLIVEPNELFFLRHHPKGWECEVVDDKPLFLPQLVRHAISPGALGIRTITAGQDRDAAWSGALYRAKEKGWTYLDWREPIPPGLLPPGISGSYVQIYDCQHPKAKDVKGSFYCEPWLVPLASIPGEPTRFRFERALFNAWRVWLVSTGRIKAPPEYVLDDYRAAVENRLDRIETMIIPEEIKTPMMAKRQANVDRARKAKLPTATA